MTYLELVKEYFPDAGDEEADYILWEFTAFPLVRGEDELREQLQEFKKRGRVTDEIHSQSKNRYRRMDRHADTGDTT